MIVIGVTGGIGGGKSALAERLAETGGGELLSADKIGHEILVAPEFKEAARAEWGGMIFHEGEIDRGSLAAIVFDSNDIERKSLKKLNALTHPAIREKIVTQIERFRADGVGRVILDAPLLYETGMETLCDLVVFVDASRALRLERVKNRGWSEEELARREVAQLPPEVKRAKADIVIDNNGPLAESVRQMENFLSKTK